MKIVKHISQTYNIYRSIITSKKLCDENPIFFDGDKPSRKDFFYGKKELTKRSLPKTVSLIVEQRKLDTTSFKFNLKCAAYFDKPLIRFDSDGPAHQNVGPLKNSSIATPHFNAFTKSGREIAYHTKELKNKAIATHFLDIKYAFKYFSKKINIKDIFHNQYLEIDPKVRHTMFYQTPEKDFLKQIKFGI